LTAIQTKLGLWEQISGSIALRTGISILRFAIRTGAILVCATTTVRSESVALHDMLGKSVSADFWMVAKNRHQNSNEPWRYPRFHITEKIYVSPIGHAFERLLFEDPNNRGKPFRYDSDHLLQAGNEDLTFDPAVGFRRMIVDGDIRKFHTYVRVTTIGLSKNQDRIACNVSVSYVPKVGERRFIMTLDNGETLEGEWVKVDSYTCDIVDGNVLLKP
jgi:hypothetical protein